MSNWRNFVTVTPLLPIPAYYRALEQGPLQGDGHRVARVAAAEGVPADGAPFGRSVERGRRGGGRRRGRRPGDPGAQAGEEMDEICVTTLHCLASAQS